MTKSTVSIVIPLYNEEGNVEQLLTAIKSQVFRPDIVFEIILIDDGSSDETYNTVCSLREHNENIGIIKLSRNFGHQAAILAGMRASKGDAVITMDGDMQHPPEVINTLIAKWQEGYDVVHTQRSDDTNTSSVLKKVTSQGFYKLMQTTSELNIKPGMADFRLISRHALSSILHTSESTLFFRGLSLWVGFEQATVEYQPSHRFSGTPSYSPRKMLKLAYSGILSFSAKPLYSILPFGLIIASISSGFGIYAIFIRLYSDTVISGWTSLAVLISFLFGCLFVVLGVMGAYLGAIHTELKSRPRYIVSEFKHPNITHKDTPAKTAHLDIQDFN